MLLPGHVHSQGPRPASTQCQPHSAKSLSVWGCGFCAMAQVPKVPSGLLSRHLCIAAT